LKDENNPARKNFAGARFFPINPAFRVKAKWIPNNPPRQVAIPTVLGTVIQMPSPGSVEFSLDGKTLQLSPLLESPDDKELFIIFGDQTNAKGTYGAGRFLYTELPHDNEVTLDFNRAQNPPCAVTPYATCPLPPKENKLSVAIPAGEKYSGSHTN